MKAILVLLVACSIVFFACNKDKFTTAPQVSIKSISPKTVISGNIISLKGKYTDQEGDLDSVLIVYKWYNLTTAVKNDTFRYSFGNLNIPPNTKQADIQIDFQYNTSNSSGYLTLPGVSIRDTTATLGLVLIDKDSNRSAYAESDQIRLIKP